MDQEQFQSMYLIFFFGQDRAIKNFSLQLSIDERFNNDISSDAAFCKGQSSLFFSIFHKRHSFWFSFEPSLGVTETFARCVSSSQRSERWRLLYRTRSTLQGKEALLIWPTAYVKGVVGSCRRVKVKEGNLSRLVSFRPYSPKIELFIYGTFSRPIGANARGFKSRGISLQWMRIQSLCTL